MCYKEWGNGVWMKHEVKSQALDFSWGRDLRIVGSSSTWGSVLGVEPD